MEKGEERIKVKEGEIGLPFLFGIQEIELKILLYAVEEDAAYYFELVCRLWYHIMRGYDFRFRKLRQWCKDRARMYGERAYSLVPEWLQNKGWRYLAASKLPLNVGKEEGTLRIATINYDGISVYEGFWMKCNPNDLISRPHSSVGSEGDMPFPNGRGILYSKYKKQVMVPRVVEIGYVDLIRVGAGNLIIEGVNNPFPRDIPARMPRDLQVGERRRVYFNEDEFDIHPGHVERQSDDGTEECVTLVADGFWDHGIFVNGKVKRYTCTQKGYEILKEGDGELLMELETYVGRESWFGFYLNPNGCRFKGVFKLILPLMPGSPILKMIGICTEYKRFLTPRKGVWFDAQGNFAVKIDTDLDDEELNAAITKRMNEQGDL